MQASITDLCRTRNFTNNYERKEFGRATLERNALFSSTYLRGSEKQLGRQEALLRLHDVELTGRDITQIVVRVPAENPEIVKRFRLSGAGFTLLLIGKDGGEKLRSHEIVSPETLCRLIDSMPMRKEEMRERATASKK